MPTSASTTLSQIASVNLPESRSSPSDFYFMNGHVLSVCGGFDSAAVRHRPMHSRNWMQQIARTPGGSVNLPTGTPMAVVGDFNICRVARSAQYDSSRATFSTKRTLRRRFAARLGRHFAGRRTAIAQCRSVRDRLHVRDDSSIYDSGPARLRAFHRQRRQTRSTRFVLNTTTMTLGPS